MTREFWNQQVETMPTDLLLAEIEKPKLVSQIHRVYDSSPFYRKKFQNADFSPDDLIGSFSRLPFTEKAELLEDQVKHPPFGSNLCVDLKEIKRVHRTSGTTGRPLFLGLTDHDIRQTVASGARCFWASGLRPEDMVVHCLNYCLWAGGYTDHQSLEATGATVVPYGTGNSTGLIDSILYLKPTAIHCTPSYLSKLEIILREEFHLEPSDLNLSKGFFGGEGGIQNTAFRAEIEQKWGIRAMNANYGMADVLSMFGAECGERNGLHFMGQGNLYVEIVDPVTLAEMPVRNGTRGELVLSNLDKLAQPVVRFRTHDIIEVLDHEPCACGRTSFRFSVIGRSDDMLVVKGVNVFPNSVAEILTDFLQTVNGEFRILSDGASPLEDLSITLEYKKSAGATELEQVKNLIQARMKNKLFINPRLSFVPEGSLPRTEGKTQRIVQRRPHKTEG